MLKKYIMWIKHWSVLTGLVVYRVSQKKFTQSKKKRDLAQLKINIFERFKNQNKRADSVFQRNSGRFSETGVNFFWYTQFMYLWMQLFTSLTIYKQWSPITTVTIYN